MCLRRLELLLIVVVVIVVEAEAQVEARLLPQSLRHQLLLQKQFLEKICAEAEGKVAVDEIHEAHARPGIVPGLRLWGQQRLRDGVNDMAEVRVGLLGVALEQLLGLRHIVLAVLLQQPWGQALQQLLVLLLPVVVVTGLTCGDGEDIWVTLATACTRSEPQRTQLSPVIVPMTAITSIFLLLKFQVSSILSNNHRII